MIETSEKLDKKTKVVESRSQREINEERRKARLKKIAAVQQKVDRVIKEYKTN